MHCIFIRNDDWRTVDSYMFFVGVPSGISHIFGEKLWSRWLIGKSLSLASYYSK